MMDSISWTEAATRLKDGEIGVIPTDTVYGVVALATNPGGVERIYELKERDGDKPFIVLVPGAAALQEFGVRPGLAESARAYWPGAVSVVLSTDRKSLKYLHRGKHSLAFRHPANESLNLLLAQTGPVVAPSANPQGLPPATTCQEAYEYFGEAVDFYVDDGDRNRKPSRIIRISDTAGIEELRP